MSGSATNISQVLTANGTTVTVSGSLAAALAAGIVTVAGTGDPGTNVAVSESVSGAAPSIGGTTVDGGGNWSLSGFALAPGLNDFTAIETDGSGNVLANAAAFDITVVPDAPAIAGIGSGAHGAHTSFDPAPAIRGAADFGASVVLFDNGASIGGAVADAATGLWSIAPAMPLPAGLNVLTATAADSLGDVSVASEPVSILVLPPPAAGPADPAYQGSQTIASQLAQAAAANVLTQLTVGGAYAVGAGGITSAIEIDTAAATTIDGGGADPSTPFSVIGSDGGTTFLSGANTAGGGIYLAGGSNTLTGSLAATNIFGADSTNGGLVGDYGLNFGGGQNMIVLASGSDTISSNGADLIGTGGADAAISGTGADTVMIGSGNVTFAGQSGSGQLLDGAGHAGGNDVLAGGTGGANTITAAAGNATLAGFGSQDILVADTQAGSNQMLWATGNATMLGGGAGNDTFFGFTSLGNTGNVAMSAAGGSGANAFWAGGGSDSIWTGTGSDSIMFSADRTGHAGGAAPADLIYNYSENMQIFLSGYAGSTVGTSAGGDATLTLSDGTTVSFVGFSDPKALNIIQG